MASTLLKSAYDVIREARELRLAQNRAALAELLPDDVIITTTTTANSSGNQQPKKKRKKELTEPTRKSQRLEDLKNPTLPTSNSTIDENNNEEQDDDDNDDDDVDYDMRLKIQRLKALHEQRAEAYKNPTATYEHTWMRVKTMNETQLRARIKTIERAKGQHCIVKMRMFGEVLALAGMDELADEAKQSLDRLLALVEKKQSS
jgi:hypothetical protein